MSLVLPDAVAEQLVRVLGVLNERLLLESALHGQPVLTVADLCARWQISERQFHRDYRHKLPQCDLLKGQLRFLLADVVAYEQTHRVKADGTPIAPIEPRPMGRKRKPVGEEFPALRAVAS